MKEYWRPVVGYELLYSVSSLGRVKSMDRLCQRNRNGWSIKRGGLMVGQVNKWGYHVVLLTGATGESKCMRVARLVAKAFIPNPENKEEVNHKDGVKLNDSVDNLEWATKTENERHARNVLGLKRGERCYQAKVTDPQAIEMRNERKLKGTTYKELGRRYGMSAASACKICLNQTFKHLS